MVVRRSRCVSVHMSRFVHHYSERSSVHESSGPDPSREPAFLRDLSNAYRDAYASALSIVGNRPDADDVMQEVCIVLWQKYDEFEQGTDFRKWACSIAFNVAKSYSRKMRKQASGLTELALSRIEQIRTASAELLELRREVLRECVQKLNATDRTLLSEYYGRPVSQVEFARSQGKPVDTIYTRLKRIRRKLNACISRTMGWVS